MNFIDTFELRFPGMSHEVVAAMNPSPTRSLSPPSGDVRDAPSPVAFVDGSRWIARCPNPVCGGAERVNFATGLFFCCGCRNEPWDGDFLQVTLPTEKTRNEIEAALLERPAWQVRAWTPAETVDDLLAQNAAAHLEVP